ncbi:MAG: DMT family transporter [Albidovulum sp.]|nr:DMT family transporter [Albidovulum sp.]
MTTARGHSVGILWIFLSGLCFVAVTAIVKHVGSSVPPAQAAFLRYLFGLAFLLPTFASIINTKLTLRTTSKLAVRGIAHAVAVLCWFYAMTRIPIAELTAMNYASPVCIMAAAAILLGERLGLRRILAIAACLAGILIILRPGFREVSAGHFAMLAAAAAFAISYLIAKGLSEQLGATVVVGMLSLVVTLCLAPFAAAVWVAPAKEEILWLILVAFFATLAHYLMTLSFRSAPLSVTQPAVFLQLVWATLVGAILFGEPADAFVILGGFTIVAAVSLVALGDSAQLEDTQRKARSGAAGTSE